MASYNLGIAFHSGGEPFNFHVSEQALNTFYESLETRRTFFVQDVQGIIWNGKVEDVKITRAQEVPEPAVTQDNAPAPEEPREFPDIDEHDRS